MMTSHDTITVQTASSSVGVKANKAIKFLHACFSGQHPRVRGQSMKEVGVSCGSCEHGMQCIALSLVVALTSTFAW